ncbi:MAG: peptidoglycan DD-metalloendopeptidase family protein [Luteibaculaceae bacterium]
MYSHGNASVGDTLAPEQALVVYNGENIMEKIKKPSLSLNQLDNILDSLLAEPLLDEQLYRHYHSIKLSYLKSDTEIHQMIEDFFNHEEIPFETINEINRYIAIKSDYDTFKDYRVPEIFNFCDPHPAAAIYGYTWDTSKPITEHNECWLNLTISELPLIEENLNCNFVMPHDGVLTSAFGWRYGRNHNGIDIALKVKDPIKAAFDGKVRFSGYYGSFGRVIVVRHYNGLETLYAHLHQSKVQVNDYVRAGDIIGLGGSTGRSTGPHLHFEARFLGQPINPRTFIDTKAKTLKTKDINLKDWTIFEGRQVVHRVSQGETLYIIAKKYGTDVNSLCKTNNLNPKGVIIPGQKIFINPKLN